MGTQIRGEFIGFSFGGVHSSELGIIRVSDGSRYNENLLPTIQDKTVQVPGGDGMYYFGSYYTQRQFNISIAYDDLTEEQIQLIKLMFGKKEPQKLIFDETPYKFYWAKSTGTPSLKFICFDGAPKVKKLETLSSKIRYSKADDVVIYSEDIEGVFYRKVADNIYNQFNFLNQTLTERDFYDGKLSSKVFESIADMELISDNGSYCATSSIVVITQEDVGKTLNIGKNSATFLEAGTYLLVEPQIKYTEISLKGTCKTYAKERVYKGEGTLSFICYDPFGYSVSRWEEGIEDFFWKNKEEWNTTANLLEGDDWWRELTPTGSYEDKNATPIFEAEQPLNVVNAGELETDWSIIVDTPYSGDKMSLSIKINDTELIITDLELNKKDTYIKIDSKLNLIQGLDDKFVATNTIYNSYMVGTFTKLLVGDNVVTFSDLENCSPSMFKFHYKYY